jgi:kinetochore protein Mis12/MTW1
MRFVIFYDKRYYTHQVQSVADNSAVENLPTTDSLEQMLLQVLETRKLQKVLKAAVAKNSAVIAQLKGLTASTIQGNPSPLAFLTQGSSAAQLGLASSMGGSVSEEKANPVSTNVSFALSHLSALQQLLTELRPTLGDLDQTANAPVVEPDVAKERRHYVETQSRRAMERQGIATGNQTAESFGRIASSEELAALEGLVDGMKD